MHTQNHSCPCGVGFACRRRVKVKVEHDTMAHTLTNVDIGKGRARVVVVDKQDKPSQDALKLPGSTHGLAPYEVSWSYSNR